MKKLLLIVYILTIASVLAEVGRDQVPFEVRSITLEHARNLPTNIIKISGVAVKTEQVILKLQANARVFNGTLDEVSTVLDLKKGRVFELEFPILMEEGDEAIIDLILNDPSNSSSVTLIDRFTILKKEKWQLISQLSDQHSTLKPLSELANAPQIGASQSVVTVSGNVYFHNKIEDDVVEGKIKKDWYNAPGVPVRLFLKSGNMLYPISEIKETDLQGNYSFEVNASLNQEFFSGLVVGLLHAGGVIHLNYKFNPTYIKDGNGYSKMDFGTGEGVLIPLSNQNEFTANIEIDFRYALPFYSGYVFQSFLKKIYQNNMPFVLKQVEILDKDFDHPKLSGEYYYYSKKVVLYKTTMQLPDLIYHVMNHELGHHYHTMLNKNGVVFGKEKFVESFAEFFSNAISLYGETLMPMYYAKAFEHYDDYPLRSSVGGESYPDHWDHIAHFVNLYDDPRSHNYGMMPAYAKGDNDGWYGGNVQDPTSNAYRIFKVMEVAGSLNKFNELYLEGATNYKKVSYNQMIDFETITFKEGALSPHAKPGSPVQVGGISKEINIQNPSELLINIYENDYFSHASEGAKQKIIGYPDDQDVKKLVTVDNLPTGYRLYKKINGHWEIVKEFDFVFSIEDPIYTYSSDNLNGTYRITTFNSFGEAIEPPQEFQVQQLSGSIIGEDVIKNTEEASWYVQLNGEEVKEVKWYTKFPWSDEFELEYEANKFVKKDIFYHYKDFYLRAVVTSQTNKQGVFTKFVAVKQMPLSVEITGPKISYANEEKFFNPELIGIVEHYPIEYTWGIRYEGDVFFQKISNDKIYVTSGEKNYVVRVQIEDAKGNIALSKEHPVIVVAGPIHGEIDGPVYMDEVDQWEAVNVYGGTPPYTYYWMMRKPGQVLYQVVGQGPEFETQAPDVEFFELKLGIYDANNNLMETEPYKVITPYDPGGGSDSSGSFSLNLYPNPAQSSIKIEGVAVHSVKLNDQMGQSVPVKWDLDRQKLDVSGLPNGLYLINIIDKTGRMHQHRVEVRH